MTGSDDGGEHGSIRRIVLGVISGITTLLAIAWYATQGGFEAAIAALLGIAGLVASFAKRPTHAVGTPTTAAPIQRQVLVLRSDIERALDDLVSFEDGFKFQSLAVILAKQRWPTLIASERKWDLGIDALAPGFALAASLTSSLKKVRDDAQRIRSSDVDVVTLIFYTPQKVTNHTASAWAATIREDFALELIVVSREDIVTSLMMPTNTALCSTHLGIATAISDETKRASADVRLACEEQVQSALAGARLRDAPLIPLTMVKVTSNTDEEAEKVDIQSLRDQLFLGGRLVLEAPGGAGKTTTLLQLAEQIIESGGLCVTIDLPSWVDSGKTVFEFVAGSPIFETYGVQAADLARVATQEHLDIVLNGWNEVPERHVDSALMRVAGIERDLPGTGVIVATRGTSIRPPLPGLSLIRILPLNREQRRQYVELALGGRASDLLHQLEAHDTLDEITRTPLLLAEVIELFAAGRPLPLAKLDILRAMSMLMQETDEHRGPLQRAPLFGRADSYLSALAFRMTKEGNVDIPDDEARKTIADESAALHAAGQLMSVPEPALALDALCAHHALERRPYPKISYRFQHQQFQEFFASLRIIDVLIRLSRSEEPAAVMEFQQTYLDQPVWEESLRMAAEAIAARSDAFGATDVVAIGECLVGWSISVDPICAAGLADLCGPEVWTRVRERLGLLLRRWYRSNDEHHRRCAMAGMLASGSPDFADIVVPLLTGDDHQAALRAYRAFPAFPLSMLGGDWRGTVEKWSGEHRMEFLHEVTLLGRRAEVAEEFALTDSSPIVRAAAIQVVMWRGSSDAISRVFEGISDETLEALVSGGVRISDVPGGLRQRVSGILRKALTSETDLGRQLRIITQIVESGDDDAVLTLKEKVAGLSDAEVRAIEPVLLDVLNVLPGGETEWVSQWIAEHIVGGQLWPEQWSGHVTNWDRGVIERAWSRLSSGANLDYRERKGVEAVLINGADRALVAKMLRFLYGAYSVLVMDDGNRDETVAHTAREVADAVSRLPPALIVTGLVDTLSRTPNLGEVWTVAATLGRLQSDGELFAGVAVEYREQLRERLSNALPLIFSQEDAGGGLKAEFALALARLAIPSSVNELQRLIGADIERRKRGLEARARGKRGGLADGATTSWSGWYVRALSWLGADVAEPILLGLLDEPLYEEEAALTLAHMADPSLVTKRQRLSSTAMSASQVSQHTSRNEGKVAQYAEILALRVRNMIESAKKPEDAEVNTWRVKRLARVLAKLEPDAGRDVVMNSLALPGEWDGSLRADTLEDLQISGRLLPTDATLAIVDPAIEHTIRQGSHNQQNAHLLSRFARILLCVDDPARGCDRIRTLLSSAPSLAHHLDEIVTALGRAKTEQGFSLLRELVQNGREIPTSFSREWVDAIAAVDVPRSRELLVGFVDPDLSGSIPALSHDCEDVAAKHIAALATRDPQLRARLLKLCERALSPVQRQVLAGVLAELGASNALTEGLMLLDDRVEPAIPYALARAIEQGLVERRPYRRVEGSYTLHSRNGVEVRRRLFDLVISDGRRRNAAWRLLGEIEGWRLEYGKPDSEPRHPAIDSGVPWPPLDVMQVK